jgi:UDP-N-acetylmuramate: L-alanyl-gamma-D-glutamyl-meso-diaminopimelate ligase
MKLTNISAPKCTHVSLADLSSMRVHFIAIGGAAMHNLAIALKRKGMSVTCSDDEIFEPSKGRLAKEGILPQEMGWNPHRIHTELDAVILGMHARLDNPELIKAKELGLKIYSYPEYLYEQSKDKKRVVIGGSHGKTSITAMILHVLGQNKLTYDYMVGAQLDGFDCMVKISDAPIIILEGDEYLSSPIDRRPKFHLYRPHIAVLSGIAWDHINVFPTFENYLEQFSLFAKSIQAEGSLFYYCGDEHLKKIASEESSRIHCEAYGTHAHEIQDGITVLKNGKEETPIAVFGKHNLQNLSAAKLVCLSLGVSESGFYSAISSFGGAARRLELVRKGRDYVIYKDFAHSPSKLKATTDALKEQYPDRALIACMELHTFSSLNKQFLQEYKGSMSKADKAFVFYDPEVVSHKRLDSISKEDIFQAFGSENVTVFDNSEKMLAELKAQDWHNKNLLFMSSGNFNGLDFAKVSQELIP